VMSAQVASTRPDPGGRLGIRWADPVRFSLLAMLAAVVVGPQIALALEALRNTEIRAILSERPLVAAELALALAFWIGIFAWPLRKLAKTLRTKGNVTISRDVVCIERPLRSGKETWSLPLNAYEGLAHHVRSTISGTEHALVLEHADPARSISLLVAEHIDACEIQRVSVALALPQISPKTQAVGAKSRGWLRTPHFRAAAA
jgi:hypothetical protein